MIGCLVIHGYTGGPYELEPLTDFLKEKTNWIIQVPILPGHGKNLSLEDKTYDEWLDAAEHALHQMREKCNEIYVIGFSMGGMIAAYLAAKHHVDKLVLLAPAGKYLSFKHLFAEVTDMLKDAVRGKINKNRFYLHYKRKWGTIPLRANIEFMKLIHATKKYLKSVQSPVLIAQGQLDSMVPIKLLIT
ncbi:alpha/beta hydrolase [Paracerasibacillus soli]|uniref:Alpha/beta fold hydrolase n=1 Tax=Paracerasibacillus soli TaxID=480284 RepID=A0ABU5CVP2_9BACI|nr:alpha/beta fold hydrolase [Virgibacillus soli]MDY0410443.1 alpha/beta fold hydrolase [Virgibacillus soli]